MFLLRDKSVTMTRKSLTFFAVLMWSFQILIAQTYLLPSISDGPMPTLTDELCDPPVYPVVTDELEDGPFEGDAVPEFTLYSIDGEEFTLSDKLSEGKPVLLISGSYTCWVYRSAVDKINGLQMLFGDYINIAVVYTVEAHPTDTSVYFNDIATGWPNYEDDVLYPNPTTYGERIDVAEDMLEELPLNVPLLMDSPCNDWWLNFGTNPNAAFFITPEGLVFDSQEWFDRYPESILETIASYFDIEIDPGGGIDEPYGAFELGEYEEECASDVPGMTIITEVEVNNLDTLDALFNIVRLSEDIPEGWETSLCTDICYPPNVSYTNMYLDASVEDYFSLYFYTDEIPAEGEVDLLVKHEYRPDNTYNITLKACTEDEVVTNIESTVSRDDLYVYPNPASSHVNLTIGASELLDGIFDVYNTSGQHIMSGQLSAGDAVVEVADWPKGFYMLRLNSDDKQVIRNFVVQ